MFLELRFKPETFLLDTTSDGKLLHSIGALHWKDDARALLLGLECNSLRPPDLVGA